MTVKKSGKTPGKGATSTPPTTATGASCGQHTPASTYPDFRGELEFDDGDDEEGAEREPEETPRLDEVFSGKRLNPFPIVWDWEAFLVG